MGKISSYSYDTSPVATDYLLGNQASGPTTSKFKLSDLMSYYSQNLIGVSKNPSKFSVYRTAGWTAGTPTNPVVFDTVTFDTNEEYDVSTGLFTATQAGFYRFSANCGVDGTNNHGNGFGISLQVNGSTIKNGAYGLVTTDEGWGYQYPISGLVQLSAGDTVGVAFYGSGKAGLTGQSNAWFDGEFVSKT